MKFENINKQLFNDYTFIYFANDVYQGTGPEFFLDNYNIVTFDYNPLVDLVRQKTNVFTIEEAINVKNETFRNSYNLTLFPSVIDYVNSLPNKKKILIFKNSVAIVSVSEENNWELCASPPELGRYFENKLKSTVYFKKLGVPIPKTKIIKANEKNIKYLSLTHEFGEKFVIQLAKGFGGSHTFIINNEKDLKDILPRISGREIKIMEFIQGKTITINACVTSKGVIASSPFLQITGIPECTRNKAGATGNEWNHESIPHDFVKKTTRMVGEFMKEQGYRGIFGLDLIVTDTGDVYFIENNARIINSIPFFTQLQIEKNELPLSYIHLLEYTEQLNNIDFESLVDKYGNDLKGAQIILH
ncbi:ATP-grasp domain-containing protein, partial [Candidatus Poribacteria bacterium]|nr:ATP-grasp domain-containing protein [Candidatus Poribacteria bacterium]